MSAITYYLLQPREVVPLFQDQALVKSADFNFVLFQCDNIKKKKMCANTQRPQVGNYSTPPHTLTEHNH